MKKITIGIVATLIIAIILFIPTKVYASSPPPIRAAKVGGEVYIAVISRDRGVTYKEYPVGFCRVSKNYVITVDTTREVDTIIEAALNISKIEGSGKVATAERNALKTQVVDIGEKLDLSELSRQNRAYEKCQSTINANLKDINIQFEN